MFIKVKCKFRLSNFLLPFVSFLKTSKKMKSEEINIEDLLIRCYDRKTTADEMQEIEAWLEASDENRQKAQDVFTLLLSVDTKSVVDAMDMEEELAKVKKSITVAGHQIAWWKWVQRVAAILFIPMAVTVLVLLNQSGPASSVYVQMLEVQSQPGVVTSLRLPDSTLVYLNSASTLRYPSVFTGDTREITLSGEAYFDVMKDPAHRFIVSTPQNSRVEVLGTRFNLEAFDDMDEVVTTLVEGKVEFAYRKAGREQKISIKPGQKTVYNKNSEEILVKDTNGESELSWKDKKVVFDHTPLQEALHMLKKRYNVEFRLKTSKYDKYTFTGTFTDQYVDEILDNFKISSHIRWRVIQTKEKDQGKRLIEIY